MITIGNKEPAALALGRRALASVYMGARLLWEAVNNCIAGGWWQRGHGWQHGTGWRQSPKIKP